jgi:hypothetical protein
MNQELTNSALNALEDAVRADKMLADAVYLHLSPGVRVEIAASRDALIDKAYTAACAVPALGEYADWDGSFWLFGDRRGPASVWHKLMYRYVSTGEIYPADPAGSGTFAELFQSPTPADIERARITEQFRGVFPANIKALLIASGFISIF